jgi:O-antigen/teichoic acid export membrane protein
MSTLYRNISSEAASRITLLIASVALIPLVITKIGIKSYGGWETIVAISTLGNIFYASFNATIIWIVSTTHLSQQNGAAKYCGLIISGTCIVLAGIAAAMAIIFSHNIIVLCNLPVDLVSGREWQLCLVGSIGAQGIIGASESMGSALAGLKLSRYPALTRTVAALCFYALSITGITLGFGLLSLVFGQVCMGVLAFSANSFILFRKTRGSVRTVFRSHSEIIRYWLAIFFGYFAAAVKDNGDRLVTSLVASSQFVAFIGIAGRISGLIAEINRYAYVPLIAEAGARTDVKPLLSKALSINSLATGALGFGVLSSCSYLFSAWVGNSSETLLFVLFVITCGTLTQLMLTGPTTAICRGIGHPFLETKYIATTLIANVLLSVPLTYFFGAFGKLWATTLALVLGSVFFVFSVCKTLEVKLRIFKTSVVLCFVTLTFGPLINYLFRTNWLVDSRSQYALAGGVILVTAALLFTCVSLFVFVDLRTISLGFYSTVIAQLRNRFQKTLI